jgi:hypothetical protein
MSDGEEPLDPWRDRPKHQSPITAKGQPVSGHKYAEAAAIDQLHVGEIHDEIVSAGADRLNERDSDIGHGSRRQPAA